MVKIVDKQFSIDDVDSDDVLICTVGYEERSTYILDKFKERVSKQNILVFCFEDLLNEERITSYITDLNNSDIFVVYVLYEDDNKVFKEIINFLSKENRRTKKIFIDYSAMPRTWYSKLPTNLISISSNIDYLYVLGKYQEEEDNYPCAGIDSFSMIGKPSLRNSNRLHVIGIGYDSTRTTGLISILDPDAFCICSAHHSKDDEMEKRVQKVNKSIVSQSLFSISLYIDDFSYMVAKLCELAYEYSNLGDVIFVPDGPKPLIMAMSMVPQIVKKEGIMCMHISRNSKGYKFVNVLPTDTVISFSVEDN